MVQLRRSGGAAAAALVWFALAGAAASGCRNEPAQSAVPTGDAASAEVAVAVKMVPARRESISTYLVASSTLAAKADVAVLPKVTGRIERVLVEVGDKVAKGQLLAKIEDREYRLAAERARIERDKAEAAFERMKALFKRELTSRQAYQDAEFVWRAAKNNYETAQLQLDETEIRAPIAGRVVDRAAAVVGAQIAPQAVLFRLIDFDTLELAFHIPEKEVAKVRVGQEVELTADSYPDLRLARPIDLIDPIINPATGTQRIVVHVPDEDPRLKPGLFFRAKILTETHPDALVIPKKALLLQGPRNRVFVARDGRAVETEVQVGIVDGERAEVLSGLTAGDRVIAEGHFGLRPDSPVVASAEAAEG